MELDITTIKELVKILIDNKLDSLKLADLEISKSKYEHVVADLPIKPEIKNGIMDENELLYYSTSSQSGISNIEENPYLSPKLRNK